MIMECNMANWYVIYVLDLAYRNKLIILQGSRYCTHTLLKIKYLNNVDISQSNANKVLPLILTELSRKDNSNKFYTIKFGEK